MEDSNISVAVASLENGGVDGGRGIAICCSLGRRCRTGCASFLSKINAEPLILLAMTAIGLVTTVMPLFTYWARCLQIFSDRPDLHIKNVTEFCLNLNANNTTAYQDIVERDIATWRIYQQLGSSLPTLLVSPILGAWADGSGGSYSYS